MRQPPHGNKPQQSFDNQSQIPRTDLQQAIELREAGKYAEAKDWLHKLLQQNPTNPEILSLLSHVLLMNKEEAEAERRLTEAASINPRLPSVYRNQARLFLSRSETARALDKAQLAHNQSPEDIETLSVLAACLRANQRDLEALTVIEKILKKNPKYAEAHANRALIKLRLDDTNGAIKDAETAVALKPHLTQIWELLGTLHFNANNVSCAIKALIGALNNEPNTPHILIQLGEYLRKDNQVSEAISVLVKATKLVPENAKAWTNLGVALQQGHRIEDAKRAYQRALSLHPKSAVVHSNLGIIVMEAKEWGLALKYFDIALETEPNLVEVHNNRGNTLTQLGRFDEAEASYKQAIKLKPDFAEVQYNLGNMLQELCRLEEAEESYRQAITLEHSSYRAWDNLLYTLNYSPRLSSAELYREYEDYGAFISSKTARFFDHGNHLPTEGRRVRIGYSSPDFRSHACRFFMEPMFRNHDRKKFELFAYSNTKNPDKDTGRLKSYFDHWIDVTKLSDEAMAKRIHDDGIDILVDIAGHSKGNRLPVFAMGPAPIQVSSPIGYGYSTGLKEIDYFIGDQNSTPQGSDRYFSEKILRIPAPFFVYEPPHSGVPDVSELPALRNGYLTFGTMTRTVRLNDPLLTVWKRILDSVPNSRLRLDQKIFVTEEGRELFWKRLEGLGIPRERVELACSHPHWQGFHDIDITLDCWPHNSGTTTLESLWMGVPVLSKVDRPSMGCIGASILRPLGLHNWVVNDEQAYVERAVDLSSNLKALAKLRSGLRDQLAKSSLMDAGAYILKIESAYLQMLAT